MEVKFINHLIENGIIDNKTGNQILSLYYEKCPNFKTSKFIFNELMTEILLIIVNNLNDIQKKFMCFHLPVKFIKLTENFIKEKLRVILIKKIFKNKYILGKYFFRWNRNIYLNKKIISSYKDIKSQRINTSNNYCKNNKINKYIQEFCEINNYNNIESKANNNFYLTFNNENRNKTCNYTKEKFLTSRENKDDKHLRTKNNINYIKIKNLINKNNNINKIFKNKELKNINYINFLIDKIINAKKTDQINISNLVDSYDTNNNILSTNSNTINKKSKNTTENNLPINQKFSRGLNIMDSYNKKKYKNTEYYNSSSNYKNIKEKRINDFKNEMNKIKFQNYVEENFKNEDSVLPITKICKRNDYINNRLISNTYKNIEDNNNIVKIYYSNLFHTPFCEDIKQTFPKNNFPVYNRLFEDGINRMKKQKRKKLEQDKYLDDLSNQISGEKKIVDYNRINDLYKNKGKSKTFEKTKVKVEEEEGLTFRPSIKENKYMKRIYSNFMERNFYNKNGKEYNYDNYNYDLKSQKKMTNKQKEKIINRIIDKLSMNSQLKNLSNNCDKYTKEVNNNSKSHKKKL